MKKSAIIVFTIPKTIMAIIFANYLTEWLMQKKVIAKVFVMIIVLMMKKKYN